MHWYLQPPRNFLNDFNASNSQPNAPQKTFLQVNICIFHYGSLLLKRVGQAWDIPDFRYNGNVTATGNKSINTFVLEALNHSNLPNDLIRSLQFMEFSRPLPNLLEITDPADAKGLAIFPMLTTENPATVHGIQRWPGGQVSAKVRFRWIHVKDEVNMQIPWHLHSQGAKGLGIDVFRNVQDRLAEIFCKGQLQSVYRTAEPETVCKEMILEFLRTSAFVEGRDGIAEAGLILRKNTTPEETLVLVPATVAKTNSLPKDRRIDVGGEKLEVVGVWRKEEIHVVAEDFMFMSAMNKFGRMNMSLGA